DSQRVVHAVDDVGDRVAHQDDVDARLGGHARRRIVVGGDHRELRPALAGPYVGDGDLVTHEDSSLPTAPGWGMSSLSVASDRRLRGPRPPSGSPVSGSTERPQSIDPSSPAQPRSSAWTASPRT